MARHGVRPVAGAVAIGNLGESRYAGRIPDPTSIRRLVSGAVRRRRAHGHTINIESVPFDDLRTINVEHGHDAGDHTLIDMAALLSTVARIADR